MATFLVEVTETHYIYVDAETEDEALDIASKEATCGVPDCVDAKIINTEESNE